MFNIFHHDKKEGALGYIPTTLFFFIAFQILAFSRSLTLQEYGIEASTFVTATLSALIVGKVIILTDLMPFINRFPHKPIIYNIIWKSTL